MTADTFRKELRDWLDANLTAAVVEAGHHGMEGPQIDVLRAWNRTLADAGWAAPTWPRAFGGRDADIDEELAYVEEMSRAEAPGPVNVIGVSNIAPAIMSWGTDAQRERFLKPMLRGDEIWSQGMSEPDAGSDLASLRTSAVCDGDTFVVNGQKTWNSLGQHADWCQLYVRTDPVAPKHKGISCLLVDMRTPGIEVRPVRTMTGGSTFAELFFSDVHVPVSALLGPVDQGWRVAITTLSNERAGVAKMHLELAKRMARLLAEVGPVSDPRHRDRIARVYTRIACMGWMTDRSMAVLRAGGQPPSGLGSLTKLAWSRADQDLAELAIDLLGLDGLSGPWATQLCSSRSTTIAGGTTEINRNIVGEQALGLPR